MDKDQSGETALECPNHNPPLSVGREKLETQVDTPLLTLSYVRPWKVAIADRIAGTILKSQNAQWRKQSDAYLAR